MSVSYSDSEGFGVVYGRSFEYAVIGGGIAGVSCVEQILELEPEAQILLVSASPVVKEVSNVTRLTKTLQDFIVVEKSLKSFRDVHQSVCVINDYVSNLTPRKNLLETKNNGEFTYGKLCICTGASPNVVFPDNEHVIGIRDTESVEDLTQRLGKARRVLLIGNGGIATELAYELQGVEIIWCVKDSSISAHYLDSGAAEFFIHSKIEKSSKHEEGGSTSDDKNAGLSKSLKRTKYALTSKIGDSDSESNKVENNLRIGSALGPDWHEGFSLKGLCTEKNVTIEYETECTRILTGAEYLQLNKVPVEEKTVETEWPIYGQLTNGKVYGCDLIISATGVRPSCDWVLHTDANVKFDPEKGIPVNCRMETTEKDIYAAGDVCFANWTWSPHWFQMRLWTQARQMGLVAGKSMFTALEDSKKSDEEKDAYHPCDDEPEFVFEIFSHVTRFFGFKVVLLGLYNAQGLEKGSFEYLLRYTKNLEYIKVVLQNSRMKGAILIGDTGLEETFENLILNQLDLSAFGEDLLNPDIDIEDYFD